MGVNKDALKAMEEINEMFKDNIMINLGETKGMNIERTPSGRLSIDTTFGGGVPDGKIIELYGQESSGKAQPFSSLIMTPLGWVKMGHIQQGHIISTPDGTNSTVIGIYPQGEQDVYEIVFDDKTTVKCTLDHLWEVQTRTSKFKEIISVKGLLERGLKTKYNTRKFKVDLIQPIEFIEKNKLSINPYLLGLLLGDGSLRKTSVVLSNTDTQLLDTVRCILKTDYPELSLKHKGNGIDYAITKIDRKGISNNLLLDDLRNYYLSDKYSYEKHIPKDYLFSSIENRIELLQGLIDSDGHIGVNGTISFTTTSIQLSNDFEFLTRSLGMRVSTSSRFTEYKKRDGTKISGRESYTSFILLGTLDFNVSKIDRKQDRVNKHKSRHRFRFIETIKKVGREKCQCIMIGHPNHLYITDNFTPTHNTTIALHVLAAYQKKYPKKMAGFIDFEHAFDPTYAKSLGVLPDALAFAQPDYAEQGLEAADKMIASGGCSILVIDSVAAMVPKAELEGEMGKSSIGVQARLMSQALRKLTGTANRTKTTVIFINQMREKIGVMFGSPWVTAGGNALKFYASIRAEVRRGTKQTDKEGNVISNRGKIIVVKNKTYPPYKECEFDIEFGSGISYTTEIIDFGVEYGIIKKGGSWYSYGDTKLGQGKNKVKELLEDNPDLVTELREKIMKKYEEL